MSRDQAFGGLVSVDQYRAGYRFSIDALWLAASAAPYAKAVVVDLGAGCGVVGLSLAQVKAVTKVVLIEVQPRLAQLAQDNIALNDGPAAVVSMQRDLRQVQVDELPEPAQLVVFNPPFFAPDSSRPSRDPEQNAARRSLKGGLEDFVAAAARMMAADGLCAVVFPAQELARLQRAFAHNKLTLQALRYIYTRPGGEARLVVAIAGRSPVQAQQILTACYEFDPQGRESRAAQRLRQEAGLTLIYDEA